MAYKRLTVSVRTEAPLLLGGPSGLGNYLETLDYIPGSVLRGATAARLIGNCSDPDHTPGNHLTPPSNQTDCLFYDVFGHRAEPFFGNCYPSQNAGEYSFPFPATTRTCKTHPGFIDPAHADRHHGIFDILVRQLVFEEAIENRLELAFLYEPVCPVCYGGVKERDGFYQPGLTTDYLQPEVKTERASHTAINRAREVAEDALLYTVETVDPYTIFVGQIVVTEEKEKTLLSLLNGNIELGRGVARGWGAVRIEAETASALWSTNLANRIETFNKMIEDERRFYYKLAGQPYHSDGSWYFTVDLLADACPTEDGLPSLRLLPTQLNPAYDTAEITLVRSFITSTLDSGWLAAARLPRGTVSLVKRGNLFVYRVAPGVDKDAVLSDLKTLELVGVGRGRERGLGQLVVCSPFHMEVEPK